VTDPAPALPPLIDIGVNLTNKAFRGDLDAVLSRARQAGVTTLVVTGTSVAGSRAAADLAAAHPATLYATAGVHPHDAKSCDGSTLDALRELAARPEVVAIGETGLDFHYDHSPHQVQIELFDAHLALGAETGLPVVVHAREADDEIAAALERMPAGTLGVLHCFTGGVKAFERAMAAGWYVSFSGIASFKSFAAAGELRAVPGDRLLAETDSPYLAPVPFRGKRNEPAHVARVVEAVAGLLDLEPAEVARRTTANACRFYGVAGP
jgi:TatD DNase family protein